MFRILDCVPVFRWNLLTVSWAQLSRFHLKTDKQISLRNVEFKIKYRRWILSRIVKVVLIYHPHKPIDSINVLGRSRDVMCFL
jgi:hypothetical protein